MCVYIVNWYFVCVDNIYFFFYWLGLGCVDLRFSNRVGEFLENFFKIWGIMLVINVFFIIMLNIVLENVDFCYMIS